MVNARHGDVAIIPELTDAGQQSCLASAEILALIGDKWTIMVLGALTIGPLRFNVLLRTIEDLSHRMLTLTLRKLQRDGLVFRRVHSTNPVSVDYGLTEVGVSLIPYLRALVSWADANRHSITAARDSYES